MLGESLAEKALSLPKDLFQSERCADLLRALAEPIRLRIIDLLRAGPKSVGTVARALKIEVVNASHHLRLLKNSGLVQSRRQGRQIVYRLAEGVLEPAPRGDARQRINLGCCRIEVPNG